MSGRDLGEIKIIAGWSRYKSEMSTGVSGGEKLCGRIKKPTKDFQKPPPKYATNIC